MTSSGHESWCSSACFTRFLHRVSLPWSSLLCSTTVLCASSERERISSSENCRTPALLFREFRRRRRLSLGEVGDVGQSDNEIDLARADDSDAGRVGSPAGDAPYSGDGGRPTEGRRVCPAAACSMSDGIVLAPRDIRPRRRPLDVRRRRTSIGESPKDVGDGGDGVRASRVSLMTGVPSSPVE